MDSENPETPLPTGLKIENQEWPIKIASSCPVGATRYTGHVAMPLVHGQLSIMHQETEKRRMEVRVCALCGSLYYHCEPKEKT